MSLETSSPAADFLITNAACCPTKQRERVPEEFVKVRPCNFQRTFPLPVCAAPVFRQEQYLSACDLLLYVMADQTLRSLHKREFVRQAAFEKHTDSGMSPAYRLPRSARRNSQPAGAPDGWPWLRRTICGRAATGSHLSSLRKSSMNNVVQSLIHRYRVSPQ